MFWELEYDLMLPPLLRSYVIRWLANGLMVLFPLLPSRWLVVLLNVGLTVPPSLFGSWAIERLASCPYVPYRLAPWPWSVGEFARVEIWLPRFVPGWEPLSADCRQKGCVGVKIVMCCVSVRFEKLCSGAA